jgi:Flp pilus assembly protein TadG
MQATRNHSLKKAIRNFTRDDRGNLTMTLAIASIPLIASLGMAIDYVRASRAAQELQEAADGAMLAAASAKNVTGTETEKATKRKTIASNYLNVAIPKVQDATLVQAPAIDATANSINVAIQATVKGTFINTLKAIRKESAQIGGNVDATASGMEVDINVSSKAAWTDGKSYVCMLALNTAIANAISVQGTADINAKGCGIWSNSASGTSLYMNGTAKITAPAISLVGSYSAPGGAFGNAVPKTGQAKFNDPLATQYATDYAASYSKAPVQYSSKSAMTYYNNSTNTIDPGLYVGGMTVSSGVVVNMKPGVYFIKDGAFTVKAGGVVNGTGGVTIVLLGAGALLDVQAQGNLNLKAPGSGSFAGIAIAQDPAVVFKNNQKNSVIGGGTLSIDGAVYFPSKDFYVTGNGTSVSNLATTNSQFAIIADTITIQGNGQVNVGGGADYVASGLPALPSSGSGKAVVSLSR